MAARSSSGTSPRRGRTATADELIAHALTLRRHARRFFAREVEPADFARRTADAPADAWRAFLLMEACAIPLANRLGRDVDQLSAPARALLHEAALAGARRLLAARAQLRELDALAGRRGVQPVLLKGAIPLAEGRPALDLGDIDLLLPRAQCESFVRALEDAGYAEASPANLLAPGRLRVDVHDALHIGTGTPFPMAFDTQALPGFTSLRRPAPIPHVLHLVLHATLQHGHRRGNLRDALLLADALQPLAEPDLARVRAALARSSAAHELSATLDAALALDGATAFSEPAGHDLVACSNYAVACEPPRRRPHAFRAARLMVALAFGDGASMAPIARRLLLAPALPPSRWYSTSLARWSPTMAAGVAYVTRTPYRAVALAYAWLRARRLRRRYATIWNPRAVAIGPAHP